MVNVQESMRHLVMGHQRIEVKLGFDEATCISRAAESDVRSLMQSPTPMRNLPVRNTSAAAVRISASMSRYSCKDNCACVCHRRQAWRTPRPLNKFLGTLFLGYTGIPYITPQCNSKECTQRSSAIALITYLFPSLLLARVLLLVFRFSSMNGLEFNLRVPRIVSSTARIWTLAWTGDIEGTKELFQHGLGSPFDVDSLHSETPLLVCKLKRLLTMRTR